MRHHLTGAQSVAAMYIGLILAALLHPESLAGALADRVPAARGLVAPAKAWGEAVGVAALKRSLGGSLGREVQASVAEPAEVAPEVSPSASPQVLEPPPELPPQSLRRVITPAAPLRLWVVGDSLLNMAGRELKKALETSGRAAVDVDYRPSTGLVRQDYLDWPGRLSRRLSREPAPDAILVMMGANDAQHMVVDGQKLERWSRPWIAEYTARVDEMVAVMTASGCAVYWVGLPVMKNTRHRNTAAAINAILSARAAADPQLTYLPSDALFSGAEGRYSKWLVDEEGRRFMARDPDGVHFTMSGALWLVRALSSALDGEWGVFSPRRQDSGALSVAAATVSIHRRPDSTAYVPDVGDPAMRFPILYLLPGSWGSDWPWRADATLEVLSARYGVVLIATTEETDVERWMLGEVGLPVVEAVRGIAGLSTASAAAAGLAMSHPDRFSTASRMSGVLDTLSPPWILRPPLPDLDPPTLRLWRSTGQQWVESAPETTDAASWAERVEQHVRLHAAGYRQGLSRSSP